MFLKQSLVSFSRLVEKLISLAGWLKKVQKVQEVGEEPG